jgi:2-(1,2-epoxy-1,2-dihydrophenyl)acetyl-CoA isomerase
MSAHQPILYEVSEAIATITLHRPQALNALTVELMAELHQAVLRAEEDPAVRALVLTGAGRGFCAGQDLKHRLPDGVNIEDALMVAYHPAVAALRHCRVPVTAAVNGVAAGAGFSLALACDFIVAAESARFIASFSRIALVPDLGMTYMLPRAIGRARALRVMMTGEPVMGSQAEAWGLAVACVPPEDLQPWSRRWAQQLAASPTRALRETRRLVDATDANSFDQQFREELRIQNALRDSEDTREGVQAFLDKRAAVFRER